MLVWYLLFLVKRMLRFLSQMKHAEVAGVAGQNRMAAIRLAVMEEVGY